MGDPGLLWHIPYSTKISWDLIFVVFADTMPSAKIYSSKISNTH